jgi:hypothetical protein
LARRKTERVALSKTGIIEKVTFTFRARVVVAFWVAVLWFFVVLASTYDGTMVFGFEVQSLGQVLGISGLQSLEVFGAVLLVWMFWNVIVTVVWVVSLFAQN